jgi:tetratricopeptide (TPR) repeat protein
MRPERRFVEGLSDELPALVAALRADAPPRDVMRVAEGLWLAGRADEAAALLVPLLREDRWAIAPRVLLAWCYEDTGRAAEAERCYARVRELDPANPYAAAISTAAAVAPAVPVVPVVPPVPVAPAAPAAAQPEGAEPVPPDEREAEPERALTERELREIPPSPLYSATLADIFAKQGFEEKAMEIYRALERAEGDAADVRERLRALERRTGGTSS